MKNVLAISGSFLVRNLGLKVFSVLLATGLWYAVNVAGRDAEITVSVPVRFHGIGENLGIISPPVHDVKIWIAGPRGVLQTVADARLELDYDLTGIGPGVAEFSVDRHDLRLPEKARLVRVWPARFSIRLQRQAPEAPEEEEEEP
ncbi:MAG: hypothetical protein D6760_05620 [Deltaproteobacteria bacterium]|nr:MAG: hypothetical protein D6760_05620 [Deltaproteobacteria bacterium]